LRFVLDHNVDAACRGVVMAAGHDCWTVGDAGRALAGDDDQTVYATRMSAVLVTHDREFTTRRKRHAIGWHVRLMGEEPDGPELLEQHLAEIVSVCEHNENVTVEVRPEGITTFHEWE
jgi:hypothetical protein